MPNYHDCLRCGGWRGPRTSSGQSGIYQSHDIPDLCEPCFFDEDAEIEEKGHNDLPETLAKYRQVLARTEY
jgi:hypothetical protein